MSPDRFREIAQKGKHVDPGWYRVHRRLSIHVTRAALSAGMTANDASYSMILCGAVGAYLVSTLNPLANAAGFLLFYAGFLLDKVDGELARLRRTESVRGILLDRIYHRLIEPLIFIGVAVHEYRMTGVLGVIVAGFLMALASNDIEETQQLAPYILYKRLREGARLPEGRTPSRSPGLNLLAGLLRPLKGFRMLIVVLPIFAICYAAERLWGGAFPAVALYVGALSLLFYLGFQCVYYYRERLELETHAISQVIRASGLERPPVMSNGHSAWPMLHVIEPRTEYPKKGKRTRKPRAARGRAPSEQQGESSWSSLPGGPES
jgi:hypothetical protein